MLTTFGKGEAFHGLLCCVIRVWRHSWMGNVLCHWMFTGAKASQSPRIKVKPSETFFNCRKRELVCTPEAILIMDHHTHTHMKSMDCVIWQSYPVAIWITADRDHVTIYECSLHLSIVSRHTVYGTQIKEWHYSLVFSWGPYFTKSLFRNISK